MSGESTLDGFLGGRLTIAQPKRGFRAGHDTVLLAAAVPAQPGSRVLELGSGVGVASLCLAARVPGADVLGIEIDADLVALANANAARNGIAERVRFMQGDIEYVEVEGAPFDHVFLNPPFHPDTGHVSADPSRDRAMRAFGLAIWVWRALDFVKPNGTITAIVRADRSPGLQSDVRVSPEGQGVSITAFPLFPHAGEEPKRIILQFVRDAAGGTRTAAGLVLHEANGRNTEAAEAVLRGGAALRLD